MMNQMGLVRLLPLVVVVVVEVVEMVLAVVEFESAVVFGSQPHDCIWMRCSSYDWMVTVAVELVSLVVQICYRMFAPIAMTVRMIQPFTHIIVDWRKLFTLMGIHIFLIIEELYKNVKCICTREKKIKNELKNIINIQLKTLMISMVIERFLVNVLRRLEMLRITLSPVHKKLFKSAVQLL